MAEEIVKRRPPLTDPVAMPIRLDRLLAFILEWQNKHHGFTPSMRLMTEEMNIGYEAVKFYLNRLSELNRINLTWNRDTNQPKVIIPISLRDEIPGIVEARRLDDALVGRNVDPSSTPSSRYEAAQGKRINLAKFIGAYNKRHGQGPTLREMMEFTGSTSEYTYRMVGILEEQGYVMQQTEML